jgi:hypothetical protein
MTMTPSNPGPLFAQPRTLLRAQRATIRSHRRHRRSSWQQWAVVLTVCAGMLGWAWAIHENIEVDPLDIATPVAQATRTPAPPLQPAATLASPVAAFHKPAGPRKSEPPQVAKEMLPVHVVDDGPRSVPAALLRAARECVARRIVAVWGSVREEESMRAADVDLLARGLSLVGFELREAIIRHRVQQPKKYSKAGRPRTAVAHARVLTTPNVTVFLDAFASREPTAAALEDAANWRAGDIVLVKPSPRRAKLMVAVVSDRTDDEGISLLITLDPADKLARELHTLDDYPIRSHFRLTRAQLDRARHKLGMPAARPPRDVVDLRRYHRARGRN